MAHINDLKSVIHETMERRGVINALKGKMRAEVFNSLDDKTMTKPRPSNDTILINELLREYLIYNNYHYAAMTLQAESGQGEALSREFLEAELKLKTSERNRNIPLLYHMLHTMKETEKVPPKNKPLPSTHSSRRHITDDSQIVEDELEAE